MVSYETYLADKYLKRKGFEKGFEKTYFPPQFVLKYVNNFQTTYIFEKKKLLPKQYFKMLPLKFSTKRLYNHFNLSTKRVLPKSIWKEKVSKKVFEKTSFSSPFSPKYVNNFYTTYILKKKLLPKQYYKILSLKFSAKMIWIFPLHTLKNT